MLSYLHAHSQSNKISLSVTRIIVKFTDASRAAPKTIRVFAPNGGTISLRHIRAMSGGAQLYSATVRKAALATIISQLNQRPDVEYAEVDRELHTSDNLTAARPAHGKNRKSYVQGVKNRGRIRFGAVRCAVCSIGRIGIKQGATTRCLTTHR